MDRKVEVRLEDDFDGDPAEDTITFALDGKDYEIDLSTTNAEELREALRPCADASLKTARNSSPHGTSSRASGSDPGTGKILAWAKGIATKSPTAAGSTRP